MTKGGLQHDSCNIVNLQGDISNAKKHGVLVSEDATLAHALSAMLSDFSSLGRVDDPGAPGITCDYVLAHSAGEIQNDWLLSLRQTYPAIPILLLRDKPADEYLPLLQMHAIRHLLSLQNPFFKLDLASAVKAAVVPDAAFELGTYINTHGTKITTSHAASETDRNDLRDEIVGIFSPVFSADRLSEVQLCFDELISNCFYHAFRDQVGVEKYDPASFICLMDGDSVTVEMGTDELETCIISMTDNAGSLIPGRLMTVLDRQASRAGIYDERGRGFYLMRSFAQRMVVSIEAGIRTRITLLFRRNAFGWKPLEVNCFYDS